MLLAVASIAAICSATAAPNTNAETAAAAAPLGHGESDAEA